MARHKRSTAANQRRSARAQARRVARQASGTALPAGSEVDEETIVGDAGVSARAGKAATSRKTGAAAKGAKGTASAGPAKAGKGAGKGASKPAATGGKRRGTDGGRRDGAQARGRKQAGDEARAGKRRASVAVERSAARPVAIDRARHELAGDHGFARARLSVHPQGYGFAEPLVGGTTVFVPAGQRAGAMDGDEVLVESWPSERGREGAVRSVVSRKRTRLTGIVRRDRVLEPDDPRVLDPVDVVGELPSEAMGNVCLVDIIEYPGPSRSRHVGGRMLVTLDRVLGPPGRLATEEIKILLEHGVDPEFPPEVLAAARDVPTAVRPQDLENRRDLRHLEFVTIDPPDARDFDDAVCMESLAGETVRVHVAVADVSHYVREGDPFDVEAARRCFSCYLPDRAVPMLPPQLSSVMCSLVPKEDRLAMVVSFDVDARGNADEAEVCAAVIRSRARWTYEEVAKVLIDERAKAEDRTRMLALRGVADRLRRARMRRGAIELTLPEVKIVLDQDDPERVREVVLARGKPEVASAYNLIEELMLGANEAVARLCMRHKLPAVYRVHAPPDEQRIERFCAIAALLGVETDPPETLATPKGMQNFLKQTAKHPRRPTLHGLLLRAMAQAEYAVGNIGHFALASAEYLHFTSPIRRYPDLLDHRLMKAWLRRTGGPAGPEPVPKLPERTVAMASSVRASERERAVAQAERDAKSLLAAAFMRDRIGDRFAGMVTGLSPQGAWVQLDSPPVDGV
ncbi:MAG TPA: ribonuclease R family protein, partial [Nannocystaceae bacterium]|nr:ribonuclease R family protein [Nannocystaceae bacterium]